MSTVPVMSTVTVMPTVAFMIMVYFYVATLGTFAARTVASR